MSGRKINMYVKQLSHNSVSGFIIPQDGDTYRIQIRLKIDEAVYNTFLEQMTSPYVTVFVDGGTVVDIDGVNILPDSKLSIEDYIHSLVLTSGRISKKELHSVVSKEFNVSSKTIQRTLNTMVAIYPEIRMNYNEVYLWKKN